MKDKLLISKIITCLILLTITACIGVKNFEITKNKQEDNTQSKRWFYEETIFPLKREWPELYAFLKKGHLRYTFINGKLDFYYSMEFYHYIVNNQSRITTTEYLRRSDNIQQVFGEAVKKLKADMQNGTFEILKYTPKVVDDTCKIYKHAGFVFVTDQNRKLTHFRILNNSADWE